jgi:O-antigen/teichoic acid export membrane protein
VLDTLSQLSLQVALLRMPQPTRAHYDTAWTMGLMRALLFALMLSACASLLSDFVHDGRLRAICYALSAIIFLQGLENIHLVEYQRAFRYDRIFFYQLAGKLSGFVVGTTAAFLLRDYWALVIGTAAARLFIIPLGYAMRPYRPRFDLSEWREFFHFSKWLMVTNTLWVIDGSMIMFVLGRILGASGIGTYQIANQVGSLPASEIAAPIRDPATAGYARVRNAPDVMRQSYLENLGLLVAVVMPLSLGIAVMAEPVTLIFLGAKWAAATPLVAFCALFALFDCIAHFPGGLFLVLDRQKSLVYVLVISLAIRLPALIIAAKLYGMTGAMTALTASAFLNMFIWTAAMPAAVRLSVAELLRVTWRSILSCAVMVAAVHMMMVAFPASAAFPALLRFVAIVLAGGAVLLTVQYALWMVSGRPHSAESMALSLAAKAWRKLNPSFRSLPG